MLVPARPSYGPVPSSSITCGFEEALSMMLIVPSAAAFFVGEKVALIVQFAPAATVEPQLEVRPNSALAFMDLTFSSALPVLVSVMICALLVLPTR